MRITIPNMKSLRGIRPQIQGKGDWLCHNHHATIATVGTICLAYCCSIQGPALGETTDVFSPPVSCIACSSTVTSSQEGKFPGLLALISLCLAIKVVIYSAMWSCHLVLICKKNQWWYSLGTLGTSLTKPLVWRNPTPGSEINNPCLLGTVLPTHVGWISFV